MLEIGTYIADRYEIVSKVGAGGMSDVYKAKDHVLSRNVAIKVLKTEFSEDRSFVTKFRTEAQSAAGLEHPNIVNIYDVGSEDGIHYIVMEYVEGITLKTYVEKKGHLNFKESISIAIQVARGIESAHNKHLIHRDIKPQNIIISTEGKVKVTDFGIARAASSNTISADVMGSVHYASPEQARNGFVDGRSDIYSLGIVMYEMVTGRVPFDGDTTVAVALQHLQEEMTPPSKYAQNLPVSMEKIILKCTQKNPDRRYQSIEELLNDLRKSLVNPNEDFVVIAPLVDNGKTKIISEGELEQIRDRRVISEEQETDKKDMIDDLDMLSDDDDDDEEGNGRFLNPKLDKFVNIMMAVFGVVIVIAIIVLVLNVAGVFNSKGSKDKNNNSETEQVDMVRMIKVTDYTEEEARKKLKAIGLNMNVVSTEESDKEEGTVIEQKTPVGTDVPKGTYIDVVVAGASEESATVRVPSVKGKAENEAVSELTEAKLKVKQTYEYNSTVTAGNVISQDPEGGTKVPEDTEVTIVVSQGVKSTEVPSVSGKTQEEAEELLEKAGLKCKVEEVYDDSVSEGEVISQDIQGGKTVQQGTTVTIKVSKGTETVRYTCNESVPLLDGTTHLSVTLKGSDGSLIWSQNEYELDNKNLAKFTVKKTGLSVSSGTISVTYYKEVTETSYTTDENGEEVPVENTTLKEIGSDSFNVNFTKEE